MRPTTRFLTDFASVVFCERVVFAGRSLPVGCQRSAAWVGHDLNHVIRRGRRRTPHAYSPGYGQRELAIVVECVVVSKSDTPKLAPKCVMVV